MVVQEISTFQGDRRLLQVIAHNELSQSKRTAQTLRTFIDTVLLRNGLPSRRGWLGSKGRIMKLREELRIERNHACLDASNS